MGIGKAVRISTAVATVAILSLFYIFAAKHVSDDDDFMMFFTAVIAVIAIATIAGIFRPLFRKHDIEEAVTEWECPSCGSSADITEHTCPRCGTIRPARNDAKSNK